ncbi:MULTISPECIES: hypothetical protein [Streptomyces]|uniref:DUF8017 domain-containing protein n=1 Tax=Streptomyces dengpaensis TaxID=2049881 RepID=A0ABM6SZ17_9ACTN|nr:MULTISPECIES: hypothetical protein [Streptomyces]AVH60130.1 hypothetical protein C4B68_34965 [Streptomyces dengpaensis]PIB04676.1 hypothetical protein B1C81_32430 [Streptomyces sp. HG99]
MWPGQQPPGGEQNPQDQNPYQQPGYQQPNPYQQPGYQQTGHQQPGYQQPNAYGQQPGQGQWGAPSPMGTPGPPSGGGNKTKVVAILAATAVVVAAGVTGFLVLGGDKDDKADDGKAPKQSVSPSQSQEPSASASDDNPRGGDAEKATIAGWKVVVNPKWGTAFDVPADWEVESPGTSIGFEKHDAKAGDKPIIVMSAPAYYKSKWCTSDDDKDGTTDDTALGAVGTKGASGAKSTDEVAVNQVPWWVYGGYTQPDKKSITFDEKAKPYTTTSGVEGSVAWARSKNTPQKGKCASDGKAVTFGFKNSAGDYVAWNLYGATGVDEEIPDATILKILSTVRLHGEPTES